jgi:DNA ligase-1
MSEKLDGVRCFWTGTAMYSRNGNRFFPPKWFTKNWPKSQLDGELFIGRGQFSKTISAVKKGSPIDSEWENVRYLVFDAPGLKQKFKKRIETIKEVIESLDNNYIKCHSHR